MEKKLSFGGVYPVLATLSAVIKRPDVKPDDKRDLKQAKGALLVSCDELSKARTLLRQSCDSDDDVEYMRCKARHACDLIKVAMERLNAGT